MRTQLHRGPCVVRLRRRGRRRHRLLVRDGESGRWSDAVVFADEAGARQESLEHLRCASDAYDSAQVLDARTGRVLGTIWIERAAGVKGGEADAPDDR